MSNCALSSSGFIFERVMTLGRSWTHNDLVRSLRSFDYYFGLANTIWVVYLAAHSYLTLGTILGRSGTTIWPRIQTYRHASTGRAGVTATRNVWRRIPIYPFSKGFIDTWGTPLKRCIIPSLLTVLNLHLCLRLASGLNILYQSMCFSSDSAISKLNVRLIFGW